MRIADSYTPNLKIRITELAQKAGLPTSALDWDEVNRVLDDVARDEKRLAFMPGLRRADNFDNWCGYHKFQ